MNVLEAEDGGSRPPPRKRSGWHSAGRNGARVRWRVHAGAGYRRLWPPRCAVVLWLPGQFVVPWQPGGTVVLWQGGMVASWQTGMPQTGMVVLR